MTLGCGKKLSCHIYVMVGTERAQLDCLPVLDVHTLLMAHFSYMVTWDLKWIFSVSVPTSLLVSTLRFYVRIKAFHTAHVVLCFMHEW